jgi:uncharacterized protein
MTPNMDLAWQIDDLAARVPGIEQVVMLSRDGLALGSSRSLRRDETERLAALAADFRSLGAGTADYLSVRGVRQIVVDMEGKYLFITSAGPYGALAVVTSDWAEMGLVGYEMIILAQKLGEFMPAPSW